MNLKIKIILYDGNKAWEDSVMQVHQMYTLGSPTRILLKTPIAIPLEHKPTLITDYTRKEFQGFEFRPLVENHADYAPGGIHYRKPFLWKP